MLKIRVGILAICVLLSSAVNGHAQATTATLHGIIRDQTGGVLPGQTGFLLDGTDVSTRSNFRTPGSAAGVVLGVE